MTNAPDDLADIQAHLQRALDLMDAKHDDYIAAGEYHAGTRAEIASSDAVRKIIERSAEAHPISLAHIAVDAPFDKIQMTALTSKDAAASARLATFWEDGDVEDESDDWYRKAGTYGDYYVIVDITETDTNGNATKLTAVGSSPLSTITMYSTKDQRTALYSVKRWRNGKDAHAIVYYDDVSVRLVAAGVGDSDAKPERFEYEYDLDESGLPVEDSERPAHQGGRQLVTHIAVDGKPYGTPVHIKAFGPQDAITKISATNLVNVDGQGFGARWALADPDAEIDDDIDDDFGDNGPGTTGSGDGQSTAVAKPVKTVPGAVALLRGIKQIGEFTATSSDDFLKNLDWYVRVMAVATGVPLFEFDLNGEQPSGEARRRAEGRLNRHVKKIIRALSNAAVELGVTVLAVQGVTATVEATFAPTENETDKDGLELVSTKVKAGVPLKVALLEAGYAQDLVDDWYPEEFGFSPDVLAVIADVLAKLGNAKTLGVISDEELRDMVPTVLKAARGEGAPAAAFVTAPPQVDADA